MAVKDVGFRSRRIAQSLLFCALLSALFTVRASAQLTSAVTGPRHTKEEALGAIPFGDLNPVAQQKVSSVVNRTSLYRRLPLTSIEADPEYFRFLLRNPEVVVEIWRLMGVTKMTADRTGEYTLHCNDGAGTVSDVELLYGTDDLHIYWATGEYNGSMIKRPLTGQCILLMRCESRPQPNGGVAIQNTLDVFLRIDNATAGLVAKTLQPIVGKTADHNFVESLRFVQRLNETTEKNGPGVQGMATRLEGLSAPVREQFIQIADVVFQRAQFASHTGPITVPTFADRIGSPTAMPRPSNVGNVRNGQR